MAKQDFIVNSLQTISKLNPRLAVHLGLKAFVSPMKRRKRPHLLPNETKKSTETIAGKKVAVYRYGESTRKILFIHGWEGAASDFVHFFKPAVKLDFEVVAVDLPGHGSSPWSTLNAVMAGNIIRGLEVKYGPFSAIVGHSFGAFSAGYALSKFSEFENVPFISIGSPNKLTRVLSNFTKFVGFSELQKNYAFAKLEEDFDIRINDFQQDKFMNAHSGPVMVVHDKKDKVVSMRSVEEVEMAVDKAKIHLTEGLGHNRILRDKNTIRTILEFINSWKGTRKSYEIAYKYGLT